MSQSRSFISHQPAQAGRQQGRSRISWRLPKRGRNYRSGYNGTIPSLSNQTIAVTVMAMKAAEQTFSGDGLRPERKNAPQHCRYDTSRNRQPRHRRIDAAYLVVLQSEGERERGQERDNENDCCADG
jgi:hypothetical protein